MDITSCLCVGAAALAVMWKLRRAPAARGLTGSLTRGLTRGLGAALYLTVPPLLCGGVVPTCCFILICVIETKRDELLPVESRAVLITGCDSGFGLALARRLSEGGVRVFAGVLDVNGAGAQRLREQRSENLQVLQLDVTDSRQVEAARRHVCTQVEHTGLWGLVNNAGVLHCPVDAELLPLAACRRLLDVNFLSAVRMSQAFLPLIRRSRGRVVNVSSMAGEVPLPMFSAYGASKAALRVFSEVMSMELSVWGVKVALIQPAGFRTNIFGNSDDAARYRAEILGAVSSDAREDYGEEYISSLPGSLPRMSQQLSEDLSPVVDAMFHALLSVRPKPLYTPGPMAWLLPFLHRCCPTALFDSIFTRVVPKHTTCEPAGLNRS